MESMQPNVEVRGISPNMWILWLVLGVVSIGVGIWLLLSPRAAVATLAVLLALALFLNGLGELVAAVDRRRPWVGYLLGGLFLLAGIVVLLRPGKSLWFLAVFVGISIIVTGLVQVGLAVADRDVMRYWGFLAAVGAIGVVVGILAIVWPDITVFVLAFLIGIRLIFFGVVQLAVASQLRALTN